MQLRRVWRGVGASRLYCCNNQNSDVSAVYCLGKYDLLEELDLVCFNSIEFNLILFYLIEKNVFGWRLISSELVRRSPDAVTVSGFLWSVVGADDLPEILPGFLVGSWSVLMISAVADGLPVLGSAGADLAGL